MHRLPSEGLGHGRGGAPSRIPHEVLRAMLRGRARPFIWPQSSVLEKQKDAKIKASKMVLWVKGYQPHGLSSISRISLVKRGIQVVLCPLQTHAL